MGVTEILSKMLPEHAAVIQEAIDEAAESLRQAQEALTTVTTERDEATKQCGDLQEELKAANEDLDNTKSELETLKATCGESQKACGAESQKACGAFEETETFKALPEEIKAELTKMRMQKEAAEDALRKAQDAEQTANAIAKANSLKAIPVEQEKLVGIIKGASADVLDLLTVVNAALEGVVLGEVGKNHATGGGSDAWSKIESKAAEIVANESITKAKAISRVIKENPELYKEYLQGGAN